jgi:predicted O-linked N-acetylglucosamine transferase (SPINDLY family)
MCLDSISGLRSSLTAGVENTSIERITCDIASTNSRITRRSFEKLPEKDKNLIEHEARELWNACIRRRRQVNKTAELRRALAKARVLAFRIIKYGRETSKRYHDIQPNEIEYMMGLAVVVARTCLNVSELDPAKEALQALAEYIDLMKSVSTATDKYNHTQQQLNLEAMYYILRMILVSIAFISNHSSALLTMTRHGQKTKGTWRSTCIKSWKKKIHLWT